ncbi:hypothetical protein TSUD_93830, partial [Trifolium subterraneum]
MAQEVSLSSDKDTYRRSSQSRLMCFVVTAIAKLATHHRELLPRARVSLGKVARSRISDMRDHLFMISLSRIFFQADDGSKYSTRVIKPSIAITNL